MNSIFKLITNQQIPETANALVPVIGYEPWSLRALESIKSSIVNGVPTLIRVHSAADYPIENEELSHRLDMESHCVLIVGYNDDKSSNRRAFLANGRLGKRRYLHSLWKKNCREISMSESRCLRPYQVTGLISTGTISVWTLRRR